MRRRRRGRRVTVAMLRSNAVGLKEEEDELAAAGDDGVARPRVTTPAGETTAAGAVRVLDEAASGSAWNGGAKRGGDSERR